MTETNVNSMTTGSVINDPVTTPTKVKSFLDYTGLQIYTNEMQAWSANSLTKFEYKKVDTIPDTYIPDANQPRYIYMYDSDNDGTVDLYMYVIVTEADTDAPAEANYKLINIGSTALDLADYYTKAEITDQLQGYVHKESDEYLELQKTAAEAKEQAEKAAELAGSANNAAVGAAATAGSAKAQVEALASEVAKLQLNGVGGGCNCTAIDSYSITSLFAALD